MFGECPQNEQAMRSPALKHVYSRDAFAPTLASVTMPNWTSLALFSRVLAAAAILTVGLPALLASASSTQSFARIQQAVWKIHNTRYYGATATAIDPQTVVTNAHVVKGLLSGRNTAGVFLSQKGGAQWAKLGRLAAISITYDMALFEAAPKHPFRHYLEIADGSDKQPLHVMGYPNGSFKILKQVGRITYRGPYFDVIPFSYLVEPGTSGGPVFDQEQRIVALATHSNRTLCYGMKSKLLKQFITAEREALDAGLTCGRTERMGDCYQRGMFRAKELHRLKRHALARYHLYTATGNFTYLKSAAEGGLNVARLDLGRAYRKEKQFDKAFPLFQEAANMRDPAAQYELAYMPQIKQNPRRFADLIIQSAEAGYSPAEYTKGYIDYHWPGIGEGKQEALHWWKQAARKGEDRAIEELREFARKGDTSIQEFLKSISAK